MFAAMSLLMIVATVVGTGLVQAPFFRQAIIDREAAMVRDMVNAVASEQGIAAQDLTNYTDPEARKRLDRSFNTLRKLPGTERIRVFNRDNTIIWKDGDPALVGTRRTSHLDRLAQAMDGQVQAVFNTVKSDVNVDVDGDEQGPAASESIESYVPIFSHEADASAPPVIGVLALYRDPKDLNRTIRQGLYLLWAVTGVAGLVLFFALHKVFNVVYSRQQTAESKFS
jgi:hypothetical protein